MTSKTIALRFIGHTLKIPSEFHTYLDSITMLCSGNGELAGGLNLDDMYVQYMYNSDPSKKAKKFNNDVNLQSLSDGKQVELKTVILGLTFEDNEIIPTLFEAVSGVIANERIPTARFEIDQNNTIALKKMPFMQDSASANEPHPSSSAGNTVAKTDGAKAKGSGVSGKAATGEAVSGFENSTDQPQHEFDPHEAVQQ